MTETARARPFARDFSRQRPSRRFIDWLIVVGLATAFTVVLLIEATEIDSRAEVTVAVGAALLAVVPLLWRRTHQPASWAASLAVVATSTFALSNAIAFPVLLFAVYATARYGKPRHAIFAAGATAVLVVIDHWVFDGPSWSMSLTASPPLVAWLLGERVRYRSEQRVALYEKIDDLEFDREAEARKAVVEERLRFARELHDVVSHSISAVALLAGGARTSPVDMSQDAREMFATIEQTARQELAEIRQLLRALRTEGDPADVGPSVHLCDIGALARRHQVDGFTVEIEYAGDPRVLSSNVELAGYRIIHEALFNARRHGNADGAQVRIDFASDRVSIVVADNGSTSKKTTGGLGLVGMRERAELLNGTFSAGPSETGWEVHATLPLQNERG